MRGCAACSASARARRQGRLPPGLGRRRGAWRRADRHPAAGPGGRSAASRPAAPSAFRRPRLPRPDPAPPPGRRAAAARARTMAQAARCRPSSPTTCCTTTRAAHPAGRGHLHTRRLHHRRCRLPARALRRTPPASRPRRWRGCSPLSGSRRPHGEIAERCRFSLSRAALPVPARSRRPAAPRSRRWNASPGQGAGRNTAGRVRRRSRHSSGTSSP